MEMLLILQTVATLQYRETLTMLVGQSKSDSQCMNFP
jgi:hypothetical protein